MKREPIVVLGCMLLLSCTSGALVGPTDRDPARSNGAATATVAAAALEVVEVDLTAASGPADVVCTKVVRPGTRIVVGERCAPAGHAGVNVQTREDIQREISGQGWASGWKTADQIAAERRVSLGR
jgi:hypothetical protein